jgi:hypothetical protein
LAVAVAGCSTGGTNSDTKASDAVGSTISPPTASAAPEIPAVPSHHALTDLIPEGTAGLSYSAARTSGLETLNFEELSLQSWGGVLGCSDKYFSPATTEYLPAEYVDNGAGEVSLFAFRLADPASAQADLLGCNSTAEYAPTSAIFNGKTYFVGHPSDGPMYIIVVGDVLIIADGGTKTADATKSIFLSSLQVALT